MVPKRSTFDAALADAARLTDPLLEQLLAVPAGSRGASFRGDALRGSGARASGCARSWCSPARASSASPAQRALQVAAAVEMVHAYSLVHDDLPAMDDSDLRRGRPTCHKEFDDATAVLAGDGLLTLAFEVLAHPDTHGDPAVRCELVAALAAAAGAAGMVGGQMIDLIAETSRRSISARSPGCSE